jgi:DNA-binding GntR family transcriptional regulator
MTLNENPLQTTGNQLLREAVYEQLRADILSCRMPPGAEIREAPVRDALMRLERESLVITLPRQGYRVASISLTDVQDMFHLRAALERACMERIVRQASDEQLATLEPYRSYQADDWDGGFVAYNRSFHRKLAELAANARMRDQLGDLIDQMERAVLMSLSNVNVKKGNSKSIVDEHCRIIDALQGRQQKLAERLAERHIGSAAKRVNDAISRIVIAG